MDIDYLLLLQDFRNGVGSFLAPFMMWISNFSISFWPLAIMAMIYWSIDRKMGKRFLLGFNLGILANGFLKLTFCIYRLWIRDARVIPYGNSKVSATGYSFPSGHSTWATSTFGHIGFWLNKNRQKLLSIICFVIVILVLFSRNYLGVHTPQDVMVGFISTTFMCFLAEKIEDYSDKDNKRDKYVLIGGLLICVILIAYYELKSYPLVYLDDGSLLVDPNKMKGDSYQGIGLISSYVICRYFERRNFQFDIELNPKDRFIIGIFALIPLYIWMMPVATYLRTILSSSLAQFIDFFVFYIYVLIIVPILMKIINNKYIKKID